MPHINESKQTAGNFGVDFIPSRTASLYAGDAFLPSSANDSYKGRSTPAAPLGGATVADAGRRCAALDCNTSWMKPWKSRKRPIFEDAWGCSSKCMHAMVSAAVRREAGEAHVAAADSQPHRHRVPLGLVLLAQGWITHPQLQLALEAQRRTGEGRIGDWLVQSCGLEQDRVTRGLGVQWSVPVFTTGGFQAAPMALVMPKRFIAEFGLVPLRLAGSRLLYLGSENRMDAASALAVENMSGVKVESGLIGSTEFAEVKGNVLAAESVPVIVGAAANTAALVEQVSKVLEQAQPVASKLVRVHQYYWLRTWLETGALVAGGRIPHSTEDVHDYIFTPGA